MAIYGIIIKSGIAAFSGGVDDVYHISLIRKFLDTAVGSYYS